MSSKKSNSKLIQQRIAVMLALLLCVFISSVEYSSFEETNQTEQQADSDHHDTFLNVAVDAVVPFAVHVSHSVFYLIYEIIVVEPASFVAEMISVPQPNQLGEILFERIISTKGP